VTVATTNVTSVAATMSLGASVTVGNAPADPVVFGAITWREPVRFGRMETREPVRLGKIEWR
jgi:hypothetical protein